MKTRVCQLHVELKSIKKDTSLMIEFVLCVKAIENSLLEVEDIVLEQDQIDSILYTPLEEFNPLLSKCMTLMSLNLSMMLKCSFMSRRRNLISFVRSWPFPLTLQMLQMQIIKQLACVIILLIIEVVDAHIVVEGTIEAIFPLNLDLFVSFVKNMIML